MEFSPALQPVGMKPQRKDVAMQRVWRRRDGGNKDTKKQDAAVTLHLLL